MHAILKDVRITRAREDEAPACLALLPEAAGTLPELLIARNDGAFAGAAAVVWTHWAEPAGFNVLVRVLSGARGQGVGRALVTAAADLADGETDGLWSLQATPVGSPAAKFMEACGFTPQKREYYFQADVASLIRNILPVAQRYRERVGVPAGAEVVELSKAEVPLDEIAWLIAREFNNSPIAHIENLRQRREDSADRSLVALHEGEVVGALLSRILDGAGTGGSVDVNVVAKRWRYGWPNVMMMEKALLRSQADGLQQTRFYCDETVKDTMNLARRGAGEKIDLKARYYLAFG
jgi:GNAT superfamily N-acetyltransferase